jgi:DNA primase
LARIPADELERLKREVSVERLVEARGVKLRRHGKDLLGLCPFHDDHEPSLVVSPHKNLWHCLGACRTGGSVIDWVMKAEGVSFRHAVELLRGDELPASSNGGSPAKRSEVQKLPSPVEESAEDAEVLRQVVGYYHETLLESPEALEYLAQRGLGSDELIDRFRLGFANRTLGYRLPASNRKAGGEVRGRLQRLGILRDSGHEHFNGSLVVPVFSASGEVVEIYGRKIGERLRAGTPLHLYLPGPHRGVWNLEALAASKELILCESLIDAMTFWANGFRSVTAAYGVNGFTEEHLEAFEAYGTKRVLIAYDRDEAGNAAARELAEKLLARGIECYRVLFPKGMDANEYALKVQPSAQSLDLVLRRAEWMGEGPGPSTDVVEAQRGAAKEEDGEPPEKQGEAVHEAAERSVAESDVDSPSPSRPRSPSPPPPLPPLAASPAAPQPPAPPATPKRTESTEPPAPLVAQQPRHDVAADVSETEVTVALGDRRYRVRGLARNLSYDTMKINLAAFRGEGFHVDTLDLYSARQRSAFLKQAAAELGCDVELLKRDIGKVLLKLEELQDEAIRSALEPKSETVTMTPEEQEEALELLEDPRLLERVLEDLERCGAGRRGDEQADRLPGRRLAQARSAPGGRGAVVIGGGEVGADGGGAALAGGGAGQLLGDDGAVALLHGRAGSAPQGLAIAEEEGAEKASYALKLLQSEGELSIASTGKDPQTGRLQTHEYHVEGPVAMLLTTTAIEVDEELLNRCLVLSVDEGREQTRAIHERQRARRTLEGLHESAERERVRALHQNAQRLLEPLRVVNPYASRLTFLDVQPRTRRDHEKYLTLIDVIALLHQHQRTVHEDERIGRYVVVELGDVEKANAIAHVVLGRCLDDLPPQTRRLLLEIEALVAEECEGDRSGFRFTRRYVRDRLGWGDTQLKVHLGRLVDLEYLAVHATSHAQRYVYELLYAGQGREGGPFLTGLLDPLELRAAGTTQNRSVSEANRSGRIENRSAPGRPLVGGWSGPGRSGVEPTGTGDCAPNGSISPENAHLAHRPEPLVVPERRRSAGS